MVEIGALERISAANEDELDCTTSLSSEALSKRQQKRLAKRQKWLTEKPSRRAKEKEKRKKRKADRNASTNRTDGDTTVKRPRTVSRMSESACNVKVAVDLAYDHLMNESEISKTCKQIQRCYASNRRTENPLQLYITNYANQSMDKLSRIGCSQWDVHRELRGCTECFAKEEIVYLTSESPNVLTKLDDAKVYVIGGLVDHNKHKGLCLSRAEENGFGHARLPIEEFVEMKTRKVLSIVHVFEILLNVTIGMTWSDALIRSLPKRKLPALLEADEEVSRSSADAE